MLTTDDQRLRGVLALMIVEAGCAPSTEALAQRAGLSTVEVEAGLRRLHDAHALQLHPHVCRPWVVHPFALGPGSCWVQTPRLGYWANCLYCAFGIAAALESDATIATRIGGEGEAVRYVIEGGRAPETSDIFHLSTPVAHWWDNVDLRLFVVPAVPCRGRRRRLVRAARPAQGCRADDAGAVGPRHRLARSAPRSAVAQALARRDAGVVRAPRADRGVLAGMNPRYS